MSRTGALANLSDLDLVLRVRDGDHHAMTVLYRRHNDDALRSVRFIAKSESDAQDAVSEAFTRVLQAMKNGKGPAITFRSYLLVTVRNVILDKFRRQLREASQQSVDPLVGTALIAFEADHEHEEHERLMHEALIGLPARWQLVLMYMEVMGMSANQIAQILGIKPNAVSALAYRARDGLKRAYFATYLPRSVDRHDA